MNARRPVASFEAQSSRVGPHMEVRRALPLPRLDAVGPFVFLDHFGPALIPGRGGIGAHPHGGIEVMTYLIEGSLEHRDSLGNREVVHAGGVQWMSAGRGIVHAESPAAANMRMHGVQLWTTLPRALKQGAPWYRAVAADAVPDVRADGARVRVLSGTYAGAVGPLTLAAPALMWHVQVSPGASFEAPAPAEYELAVYRIEGHGRGRLDVLGAGDAIRLAPEDSGSDVLLVGGLAAERPLVFHGPFVACTAVEARAYDAAYASGAMGWVDETST